MANPGEIEYDTHQQLVGEAKRNQKYAAMNALLALGSLTMAGILGNAAVGEGHTPLTRLAFGVAAAVVAACSVEMTLDAVRDANMADHYQQQTRETGQ